VTKKKAKGLRAVSRANLPVPREGVYHLIEDAAYRTEVNGRLNLFAGTARLGA